MRVVVGWAGALALVACAGPGGPSDTGSPTPLAGSVGSPAQLARAIEDAGLGCDDYRREAVEGGTDQTGSCTIGEEDIDLFTFTDGVQLSAYQQDLRTSGCNFNISGAFHLAVGPNWLVRAQTAATAAAIADAASGAPHTIDCAAT